jgi:hypothetical protein
MFYKPITLSEEAIKGTRGCSIKLLEADGDKFVKAEEKQTQDFIMISMPTMPLGTLKLFHEAI